MTLAPEKVTGRPALRYRAVSGVWRGRMVLVTLVGIGLLALVAALNIGRGDFEIPVLDVLAVLVGGGDGAQQFIVLEVRLPRSLTGLLVGAALGLSGAITQTVARNPLASPDILGVTSGASAAAVLLIVAGAAGSLVGLPLAALFGGLVTTALVYGLAWRKGIDGYRLVLVGIGIGAVAEALTSWLLVSAKITDATRATVWLTGSLNQRGWEHLVPVAVALAVLVPAGLLLSFGSAPWSSATTPPAASACASTAAGPRCCSRRSGCAPWPPPPRARSASSRSSCPRSACGWSARPVPRCSRRRSTALCSWSRPTSSPAPCCPSSCPSASSRR